MIDARGRSPPPPACSLRRSPPPPAAVEDDPEDQQRQVVELAGRAGQDGPRPVAAAAPASARPASRPRITLLAKCSWMIVTSPLAQRSPSSRRYGTTTPARCASVKSDINRSSTACAAGSSSASSAVCSRPPMLEVRPASPVGAAVSGRQRARRWALSGRGTGRFGGAQPCSPGGTACDEPLLVAGGVEPEPAW